MRRRVTGVLFLALACPAAAADWPQLGGDPAHSGATRSESSIHAGNVGTLRVLWRANLPGAVDGAPALLTDVATPSGPKDLLFVTTRDGTTAAVDAATGAVLWSRQPASGPGFTTSSPAADAARRVVFAYGLDGMVHRYAAADGAELAGNGWPVTTTRKPATEKESSALAIATARDGVTRVYAAHGGYPGDLGDYQGHVVAMPADGGTPAVFNALCAPLPWLLGAGGCGATRAAVWGRGGVAYDAERDRVLFATGNGPYSAGSSWGDSVLSLPPSLGSVGATYTPAAWPVLAAADEDLGSTTPRVLPPVPGSSVAHLLTQVGKDGLVRLLDADAMAYAGIGGELAVMANPRPGEVDADPAVAGDADGSVRLVVAADGGLSSVRVVAGPGGAPALSAEWSVSGAGATPLVANGLVFQAGVFGLRALRLADGALLFSDPGLPGIHWQSPVVANGVLYVADGVGHLVAYAPAAAPLGFYALAPCRLVDTRDPDGPWGGPALPGGGARRTFALAGRCGIPADARAAALNVTAAGPAGAGSLLVVPAGIEPTTSTVAYAAGRTRAAAAVVALTGDPLGSVTVTSGGAATHVVIDVAGYFR